MSVFDKPRTYNRELTFSKVLLHAGQSIEITITPFKKTTLEMVARVGSKVVDKYIGREEMGRNNFPISWWIHKHSPSTADWNTLLTNWYSREVIPQIEAETAKRNILHPSQR